MGQQDYVLAERYYRTALDVDDLFFPAKMNLATLLAQQGDNAEAEGLLREVLDDYPEQYDTAYSLALLLAGLGQLDESLNYLEQAATGMPRHSRAQYNYGLLLAQLSREEEAEAALSRALKLEPASFDYLYALIDFYYKRGRFDEALTLAERMIEAHPAQRFGYDIRSAIKNR
jgi:pentatricopeptide repeat protein